MSTDNNDSPNPIGLTIVDIRLMTAKRMEMHGWFTPAVVLHLSNGGVIYAASDEGLNDPGVLMGATPSGRRFILEENR